MAKQYYTFVRTFFRETEKDLGSYFSAQGIEFSLSADFASDLVEFGYDPGRYQDQFDSHHLVLKYVALLDDYELSAMVLSLSEISIIKNRPYINFKNRIRNYFSWFLK